MVGVRGSGSAGRTGPISPYDRGQPRHHNRPAGRSPVPCRQPARKNATLRATCGSISARDPGIEEIVADPMVRAIMLADHVDPEALKTLLRSVAARPFVRHETV